MRSKIDRKARFLKTHIFIGAIAIFSFVALPAHSQTVEEYVEEALRENPGIKSAETKYRISAEKASEISWGNTEFSGGYSFGEMEMGMMPTAEFSVMQMVPWFGMLGAKRNYATALADAEQIEKEIAERNLALAVEQKFYKLYELKAKQKVIDSNVQLLQVYEQMALTSVEVGKASAVAVLRLQMRQNDLLEKKQVLEKEYVSEKQAFEKMLNRQESRPLSIPDTLELPSEEKFTRNLHLHPELVKYEKLDRAISLSESVNRKESSPQLGIGAEYMYFTDNPDMVMPMVSLSIPIFNKKYRSVTRQNKLRQEELEFQKQQTFNQLSASLYQAIASRDAARIKVETQTKNLRQAENAQQILLRSYETGTIDFREVLDVQELQLQFQMKRIEAVAAYFQQQAIIEYLVKGN